MSARVSTHHFLALSLTLLSLAGSLSQCVAGEVLVADRLSNSVYAYSDAGTLLGSCQTRFPRNHVFACSVAGATAYREMYGTRQQVPLRIEPHGIVEPFGWLVTEMK